MLQVERAAVEAVRKATSAEELVGLVQEAVRLEFSTIPPYLTAMLSLKPGQNREIWWAIHDVVIDEMLHLMIGCNLLNALGARPAIDDPAFVPAYPGPLPLGIGSGLFVGLEAFSLVAVKNVFMEIEEPELPLSFPGAAVAADLPSFSTIGEFYRTLSDKLVELGDPALTGDPARQGVAPRWFPYSDAGPPRRAARPAAAAGGWAAGRGCPSGCRKAVTGWGDYTGCSPLRVRWVQADTQPIPAVVGRDQPRGFEAAPGRRRYGYQRRPVTPPSGWRALTER